MTPPVASFTPQNLGRDSSRAQPAAAPCVTKPAHQEPARRPRERRRAASESSILIAPPASPSVRRSQSAPRARGRRSRTERADALLVLSPLLLLALPRRAGSARADTTTARAPPSRKRVIVPDRAAGFAERVSISICASRGGGRRRAVRADTPNVLTPLLLLASPRRLTESRHADRASAVEPRASRRS